MLSERYAAGWFLAATLVAVVPAWAADNPTLTVEQTVGAVLIEWDHGPEWNLYALANPDAKESLYRIVANDKLARYHTNALRAIGYIGEVTDVHKLEQALRTGYEGVLTSEERDAIAATFDALGIMSRRGIIQATDLLDKMLARSYWKDVEFRWRPETVTYPLNTVDELVSWVLYAQAKSGRTHNLGRKVDQVLQDVDGKERRQLMTERNSMRVLRGIEKKIETKEKEPVSPQLRQQLSTFFNGDLDNPAPPKAGDSSTTTPKGTSSVPENRRSRTDAKEFANAVAATFGAWIELYKQEQELRRQLGTEVRGSDEYKELAAQKDSARRGFAAAVVEHWPYETSGATAQVLAEAKQALDEGRNLHQAYREGKGNRQEVLAHWRDLADRFAGTIEHDEALFMSAMLYVQHLPPGMKIDSGAARKMFQRLAKRPGPPSRWTLMAEENLVSFPNDTAQRMNVRSQFVKDMANRLDPEWLRAHLLVPTRGSTPDRFVRQIEEFLFLLAAVRQTTAHNMVSDAKGTPDRFENLKRLKEEHADDPFVETAFARGGEAPTSSFWTYLLSVGLGVVAVAGVVWGGIIWRRRRVKVIVNAQPPDAPRRRPKR